jgi:hypothetical protein
MPAVYDRGDVVRMTGTFTSTAGVETSPTTIRFVLTSPNGVDTVNSRAGTGTVGSTSDSIVKGDTGIFYRDLVVGSSSGAYHYRFSSTGVITTAQEGTFRVRHRYTTT